MLCCQYCIEELRSRGEKIVLGEHHYEPCICEWCSEETEDVQEVKLEDKK